MLNGVERWVENQRWFAGSATPRLRLLADLPIDDRFRSWLLADDADPRDVVYQVPIAEAGPESPDATVIGSIDGRPLVDACTHPRFGSAMLRVMGRPGHGPTRALGADQSNTTVVVGPPGDGEPESALKLFRTVHHGPNPEAEIGVRLRGRDAPVPAHIGSIAARWPAGDGRRAVGCLAVAQEFVAESSDAWRVAVAAARSAQPFVIAARELGEATARLHLALSSAFPVVEPTAALIEAVVSGWRRRASEAAHDVPGAGAWLPAIESRLEAAAADDWPPLQRIHGDLHLGQILQHGGAARWRFIDFEGEPLRPLAERRRPAPALQDVAGMLRSFEYAAAAGGGDPEWAAACARGFISGYETVLPGEISGRSGLVAALLLDKALYEARYEALHRPDLLPIPFAGVERILRAAEGAPGPSALPTSRRDDDH